MELAEEVENGRPGRSLEQIRSSRGFHPDSCGQQNRPGSVVSAETNGSVDGTEVTNLQNILCGYGL